MKISPSFFDLDLQQKVNPYLSVALILLILCWMIVYYFLNYTRSIVDSYPILIDGDGQAVDSGGAPH